MRPPYLLPIQKLHLSSDFSVGQQIQILEIKAICFRFEFAARLELGRDSQFLDRRYLAEVILRIGKLGGRGHDYGYGCNRFVIFRKDFLFQDYSLGKNNALDIVPPGLDEESACCRSLMRTEK